MLDIYCERQRFALFVYGLLLFTMLSTMVLVVVVVLNDPNPAPKEIVGLALLPEVLLIPLLLNFMFMHTRLTHTAVVVQFGYLFPFFRKTIPLDTITEARAVQYSPLGDAGGWGIRWGRFEGSRCTFYNTRGKEGVFLQLKNGKRIIIGSQQPRRLLARLEPGLQIAKSPHAV